MVDFYRMLRSRHVSCRSVTLQAVKSPFRQQAQHVCKPSIDPKRKPRSCLELTSPQRYLSGILTQLELCSSPEITIIGAKSISGTTSDSDTKTLRSMQWLQLGGTIPRFMGSNRTARSSLRSKCYNASTLMRVVMDSGGYLCMAIPTIKRHDPDGDEKFISCKSCSHDHGPGKC